MREKRDKSMTPSTPTTDEQETVALRLYRDGRITAHEFGTMLGLETRSEIDKALKANGCFIVYTESEVAVQRQAVQDAARKAST